MFIQVLLFLLSFFLLYFGANFALDGAEKLGKKLGLSNLVIGLLIVGFGTSLPEFFVSQVAAFKGSSGIALGNIVGSNISNLFLIMGGAALLVPLHLKRKDLWEQSLFHIAVTVLMILVLIPSKFNWIGTIILFSFFAVYLYFTFLRMNQQKKLDDTQIPDKVHLSALTLVKLFLGFVLLYFGGDYLVSSGVFLGQAMGINEYVLSAIFVAFGTSFPEFITSLLACLRKKDVDLITGNIIGSNIFNISFVLGSIGIYNMDVSQNFFYEFVALSFACLYLAFMSWKKWDFNWKSGLIFLMCYIGMVIYWV